MASEMITIDASAAAGGIDWTSYFSYISGTGSYTFYGGTPDSAFGRTYYMNGSQLVFGHGDAGATILLDGADLAYDYMHYGAGYGHGISGSFDTIQLGTWVEGETTGEQGTGEAGRVSGLQVAVTITGLGVDVAAGTGPTADNALYTLYSGLTGGRGVEASSAALEALLGAQPQKFIGSAGADTYAGTAFGDEVQGGLGADILSGGAGDDVLAGGRGRDRLSGNEGNDTLTGGLGNDRLFGNAGDDLLKGNAGNDTLTGGAGNDTLSGGTGADVLKGGLGADLLEGGKGADTFVFLSAADSNLDAHDTIADFRTGQGDRIDLSAVAAFTFVGEAAFSGTAGELRVGAEGGNTLVEGDVDGDGVADLYIVLTGSVGLDADSFLL